MRLAHVIGAAGAIWYKNSTRVVYMHMRVTVNGILRYFRKKDSEVTETNLL